MLRLIHNQTFLGPVRITDIDDGLPNKTAHRLGSTANPKAVERDGYANAPKQATYVPRVKPTDATIQGYIDLNETSRVTLSAGKGSIYKAQQAGWITVVSFTASELAAPVLTTADLDTPGAGDLTLTGTGFLSLQPDFTTVTLTGTGAITLTQADILAGSGTISDTDIVIPAALIPGVAAATTFAKVTADNQNSAVVALS